MSNGNEQARNLDLVVHTTKDVGPYQPRSAESEVPEDFTQKMFLGALAIGEAQGASAEVLSVLRIQNLRLQAIRDAVTAEERRIATEDLERVKARNPDTYSEADELRKLYTSQLQMADEHISTRQPWLRLSDEGRSTSTRLAMQGKTLSPEITKAIEKNHLADIYDSVDDIQELNVN